MTARHDEPGSDFPAPPFASPEEEVFWGKVSAQVARRRRLKSARNQRVAATALFLLVSLPWVLWMVQAGDEDRPTYVAKRSDLGPTAYSNWIEEQGGATETRDFIGIGAVGTKGRGGGTGGYGSGIGGLGGGDEGAVEVVIAGDKATVSGPLDLELIRQVIQRNQAQLRFCYESLLPRHPALAGEVTVRFTVLPNGTVAHTTVTRSTVNNPVLEACVTGRVRAWLFPKPEGESPVLVTYPFLFQVTGK
jgi:TonB family protein